MATLGLSKVFILDKYFTELQKFWETEKKLQDGGCSSNEAVHLQQRLRSLSTELVTLRSRLEVDQTGQQVNHQQPSSGASGNNQTGGSGRGVPSTNGSSATGAAAANGHQKGDQAKSNDVTVCNQSVGSSLHLKDLIHLPGPLTEDAVLKCLQARFNENHLYTNVGPILVSVNDYSDVGNSLTLSSTRSVVASTELLRVVQEAVRHQSETGYPQAIILSGTSGSGKTYTSMLLLRQLFEVAGGGPETDAFKHLAAAFTVLRSLGSAKTSSNSESSRIGHFIEVQVTDGALYRTKIHCYFLDQTRVIRPLANEKNYHIFYQMLAGLTPEERVKLNLEGCNIYNLSYLKCGDTKQDEPDDASRFQAWKACLGVLGIPFMDVVRVLSAVLLLGNLTVVRSLSANNESGSEVKGDAELNAVASLLGVTTQALLKGITSRTHHTRGQIVRTYCDPSMSNMIRDSLAKALYCRTVATIVRRANSLKRLGSTLGTLSSDSNESVHNHAEVASQHASTIGTAGSKSSKSMAALNNAVRHATDGFIGILDMFGFEEPKPAHLEHLCINLCAETMQHFYNTHIFKSSIESCRDEGIHCDVEVDYVDNVPCIDLISSLRTGLLSMLDVECSLRGSAESYITKVKAQHRHNPRLFEPKPIEPRMFAIQHFAGRITYDATHFLETNRDVVPDDLVAVFHKQSCSFGFATHLFGTELKALYSGEPVPRGISFRISPTSHTDLLNGDEPVSTLTQDFHTRLDNLLRTLVHARPHFVRCLRANSTETPHRFDRSTVMKQIRSLQVLETVNLMAGGFPHRMRFKAFLVRYRVLARQAQLRRCEEKAVEDCQTILKCLEGKQRPPGLVVTWAFGKRHIFLSEGLRQELEAARWETLHCAAVAIQSCWRAWMARKKWPGLKRSLMQQIASGATPATVNPPPPCTGGTVTGTLPLHPPTAAVPTAAASATNPASATAAPASGAPPPVAPSAHHAPYPNKGRGLLLGGRPRPQPISGTPPPDPTDPTQLTPKCDHNVIKHTCTLFGLDMERPPPVPPSRPYTVAGNTKLGYPQARVMKMPFTESGTDVSLGKGETVTVIGASPRRGHLLVEHCNLSLHVPFQFLELKSSPQLTV